MTNPRTRSSLRLRLTRAGMMVASRIGGAEPELRGLPALVRPGDTVIDIGAAHGMYAVTLAALVGPQGHVAAFEPHPRQQRTLRRWRRLLGAPQLELTPSAVGPGAGSVTMRLPIVLGLPIYGRAHLTEGAAEPGPRERSRLWSTPMTSVDAWVESTGARPVSFIKADVEGFEPQVLEGAAATIDRDRPSVLLEIEDRHLERYGTVAVEVVAEIARRWPDYRMHVWREEAWQPVDEVTLAERNYLFATEAGLSRA